MSTILKALKQSESRRPREAALPGSLPRAAPAGPRAMRWWLPAAIVLVLAAGVAWSWWAWQNSGERGTETPARRVAEVSMPARPDPAPEEEPENVADVEQEQTAAPARPAEKDARHTSGPTAGAAESNDRGPREAAGTASQSEEPLAKVEQSKESASSQAGESERTSKPAELDKYALLPRLAHLAPARREALPALTLNAHVYTPDATQSFVLINLSRYGEGDRVADGIRVAEIFPDGVVLEDRQGRFVLPRP